MEQEKSDVFWKTKTLSEMTKSEWESLCDGCGLCCLIKLEDEDTGELFHTRLTCHMLEAGTCRCSDYPNRHDQVPDCLALSPESVFQINWLPKTCAYRLIAEGKDLSWWHPLVSGDPETVHRAGVSVRGWAMNEKKARKAYYHYIISDPFRTADQ